MITPINFKSMAMAITAIFVLCSTVDASAFVPVPSAPWEVLLFETGAKQPQVRGERMIAETFNVQAGGLLEIDVPDADVQVETTTQRQASVEIYLSARNMRRARDYFEDLDFRVSNEGNTVLVEAHKRQPTFFTWNRTGGANILVLVQIPAEFNVDIVTSDGNITIGDLVGKVGLRTSDGDIRTSSLEGPIVSVQTSDGNIDMDDLKAENVSIQTSDGNIQLETAAASSLFVKTSDGDISAMALAGNAEIQTSDGNIDIDSIAGSIASLKTSDGNISVDELNVMNNDIKSSDGDLRLGRVYGDLRAATSSGSIQMELMISAHIYLRTSDGDITVTAPDDLNADVKLEGDRIRIASSFDFNGTVEKERAAGSINGGGPAIEAYTSDGSVILRRN